MDDAFRCVQDYDHLYEIKRVREGMMIKEPKDHWHTKYEMVFLISGQGVHFVNGQKQDISDGDIFIVSPADFHRYYDVDDSKFVAIRINFSNSFYFYYLNPNCRFDEFPVSAKLSGDDFEMAKAIAKLLMEEYQEPDSLMKNELCRDLIEQLLVLVSRNCKQTAEKADDKLKAALDYIQNNFYNPIKISDIAKAASYAPNYLSSQFSKKLGISIRDYLQDIRLFYARDLIRYSDFSISEVCYKSGFKTMTYFSKVFKSKFSQSPNSYKASLKDVDR